MIDPLPPGVTTEVELWLPPQQPVPACGQIEPLRRDALARAGGDPPALMARGAPEAADVLAASVCGQLRSVQERPACSASGSARR